MKSMALLLGVLVAIASCSKEEQVEVQGVQSQEVGSKWEDQIEGTLLECLQESDYHRIEEFMGLTGRWNEVSAPMVLQYLDPEVGAEDWVKSAQPVLAEMREIHSLMKMEVALFPPSPFRDEYLSVLVESQGRKLAAMTGIHTAVYDGDVEAETEGQAAIQEIADEQSVLILGMFDELRKAGLMSQDVEDSIRDRSEKSAKLLNPQ